MPTTRVKWTEALQFVGTDAGGHSVAATIRGVAEITTSFEIRSPPSADGESL